MSMENPTKTNPESINEKLISDWQTACSIASTESVLENFIEQKASPMLQEEIKKQLKRKQNNINAQVNRLMENARLIVFNEQERDSQVKASVVGQLENALFFEGVEEDYMMLPEEEADEDDINTEENNGPENIIQALKILAIKLKGIHLGESFSPIRTDLWLIMTFITSEIKNFPFKSQPSSEERKKEISNLKNLQELLKVLERFKTNQNNIRDIDKSNLEIFIANLDAKPVKMLANFYAAIKEAREDLMHRNFNILMDLPEEIQKAYKNIPETSK